MENTEKMQIDAVIQANRLKQLAAEEQTKGARTFLKVIWGLMIVASLVPILGVVAIGVLAMISLLTCIYIGVKGNISGAFKNWVVGMGATLLALGIWAVVNFVVIALFG